MALALVEQHQQTIIGINQAALDEWIEYREFKKKPLSSFALKKTQNLLLKYGEEQQAHIIDTAIQNDWQGLHHVDMPKRQTTKHTSLKDDLTDTSWAL